MVAKKKAKKKKAKKKKAKNKTAKKTVVPASVKIVEAKEEMIAVEPSTETAPTFDANAFMVEKTPALEFEDEDYFFNNNINMDVSINELAQTTVEYQSNSELAKEENVPENDNNDNSKDDIFQTDAYDTTSTASVADIPNEIEGHLSLNRPVPKNDETDEKHDASKELDLLNLNDEAGTDLKTEFDSKNKTDGVEIIELNDEEDELKAESIQEKNSDNEINDDEKEGALFNQSDLSDSNETIVIEDPFPETSTSHKIGQHGQHTVEQNIINPSDLSDSNETIVIEDHFFETSTSHKIGQHAAEQNIIHQSDLCGSNDAEVSEGSNETIVIEDHFSENSTSHEIGQHTEEQNIIIQLQTDIEQLRADIEKLQARSLYSLLPLLTFSFIFILLLKFLDFP